MSEEFKPIRITLSEEAFDRLEYIMKNAAFRSYSSAIEECIRVVFDIIFDIQAVVGFPNEKLKSFSDLEGSHAFTKIATRMDRFTGIGVRAAKSSEKE